MSQLEPKHPHIDQQMILNMKISDKMEAMINVCSPGTFILDYVKFYAPAKKFSVSLEQYNQKQRNINNKIII